MKMTKNIIILALLIFSLFVTFRFILSEDVNINNEINKLENNNKQLVEEIDRRQQMIDYLNIENAKLENQIEKDEEDIYYLEDKLEILEEELRYNKNKLRQFSKQIEYKQMEIDYLIKNPKKRTGDELINSLKEKLK